MSGDKKINIDIRSTDPQVGKTAIAALFIETLRRNGLIGEIISSEQDVFKFFKRVDGQQVLDEELIQDARNEMVKQNVTISINDINEPLSSFDKVVGEHWSNSRAMCTSEFTIQVTKK